MSRLLLALLAGGTALAVAAPFALRAARRPGWDARRERFTLPNGWRLTPAGRTVALPGDMPGNILVLEGGERALVNTCGFHDHSLSLIDLETAKIVTTIPFKKSWIGLARRGDETLVSAGRAGDDPAIHRLGPNLETRTGIVLEDVPAKERFVSGLVVGPEGTYALNIQTDEVFLLGKARAKVGYRPYAAALSPDGKVLAVSEWGGRSVVFLDARTLSRLYRVGVASHPTALAYAPDGRLFVANAGSTTVSSIRDGKVEETVEVGVDSGRRVGPTPVALALHGDRLYVANAGENCVAVTDVSKPGKARVIGFVPTERYPTAVAVTPDGKRLLVATAKGFYGPNAGPGADLGVPDRTRGGGYGVRYRYIGEQLAGRLAIVDLPDDKGLRAMTLKVRDNLPPGDPGVTPVERGRIEREAFAKIKHVLYVIRENRTYDQVLGDLPQGDGDPSLTIFGERVTPNGHKISRTFALFDNLYTDGETSQVGHQWTDAAYANDYEEKQMPIGYSGRGQVESDERLTSSPGDYLWTAARKKGLWARVYGEYVDIQEGHDSLEIAEVKKDPERYGYSESFERIFARGGRDTEKVDDFLREMREGERTGKWPDLMVMALPEDHTRGFTAGAFSPYAMIANNDLALGRLIDAISHSRFWRETAVFVIQDDAQDGPDHVDSHRTVGYVVSPYVRRGAVDHTMYSTASMLRTMETILGLPPMTEYDAKATPMHAAFTTTPDFTPFAFEPPRVDVNERNPVKTALAARSAKLDFSAVDRADFGELNRLLWDGYRPGAAYPTIRGRSSR